MTDEKEVRVKLFLHQLADGERAGFEFEVGPAEPPTIVIRGDEQDEDGQGPFAPLHVYACMEDVTNADELADALEELAGMLRLPPDDEREDH